MENLVQAVAEKIQNLPKQNINEIIDLPLSAEEREALSEAEKLADLYEDIKPRQSRISSGHLFVFPQGE